MIGICNANYLLWFNWRAKVIGEKTPSSRKVCPNSRDKRQKRIRRPLLPYMDVIRSGEDKVICIFNTFTAKSVQKIQMNQTGNDVAGRWMMKKCLITKAAQRRGIFKRQIKKTKKPSNLTEG